MNRSSWHLRAHLPIAGWIAILLVLVLVHRWVPAAGWLMVHVLLLGIATNAILIWSSHFAEALLHTRSRNPIAAQLTVVNIGAVAVMGGRLAGHSPVVTAGAILVAAGALLHAVLLGTRLRSALTARFGIFVRYYAIAACFLPFGAAIGAWLATGLAEPYASRAVIAHVVLNILGFLGLTVLATVVTLLPTMLRTRLPARAVPLARRLLPVITGGIVVAAGIALAGWRPGTTVALLVVTLAVAALLAPIAQAAWRKPPRSYAAWASTCALLWLLASLVALAVGIGTAGSWPQAADRLSAAVPPFAVGFVAQLLTGALSYLLPVVLRGGPKVTRAMSYELDRGLGWRLVLLNLGVLLFSLPVPSMIKVAGSMLGLVAAAAFMPLAVRAIRASRTGRERAVPAAGDPRPVGSAAAGLAAVLLVVSLAVAVDPTALGQATSADDGVVATGHTTEVTVTAGDMTFTPNVIEVPAGDRLVINVHNDDAAQVHDLVLDTGHSSGRLAPDAAATVDVGVVGRDIDAWCSVVGHRQMGMTMQITVTGAAVAGGTAPANSGDPPAHDPEYADVPAADSIDLSASPGADFTPYDPQLPPAPGTTTHKLTMSVEELVTDVAPGVSQQLWTFDGRVPGPTLHGKVGDVFEVTLVNNGAMGHSVDFHAGDVSPDVNMRTIAPGGSLVYTFTAKRSGIWLYHCSTMPMSAHIASGMFGAVVIDPPDLPPVDHELLLVQSEYYLGQQGGVLDPQAVATMNPDLVVFNGYANQYDAAPIAVTVGERVRVWALAAGPNLGLSLHVVGGQFDTVYKEGGYLLRLDGGTGGAQALDLAVAQGGFVELTFTEPGSYAIVNHAMTLAERGAHGHFQVSA